MGAHKLVGVLAGELRYHLFFKGGQKIQAFHEKSVTFHAAAVVLHGFGDGHVQFLPGHTLVRIHRKRGVETLLLFFHILGIVGGPVSSKSGFRCLTACVIAGRTGKARAVGSVKLIACGVNVLNICHQIPVVQDSAGSSEELALLIQEVGGLPAGSVALEHMFGRVETAVVVVFVNRHIGLGLLAHHHAPDYPALIVRHPA